MQADERWRVERQAVQDALAAGQTKDALLHARALLSLGRATDISFCATVFRKASDALTVGGHRRLKAFVVRSVTVEPLLPALQVEAVLGGFVLEVQTGGYGSYMEEMLNPGASTGPAGADLVFVLLDTEELAGQLSRICGMGRGEDVGAEIEACAERMGQMLHSFRSVSSGRLVVQGCVPPQWTSLGPVGDANLPNSFVNSLRELNRQLAQVCRTVSDCAFLDLDRVAGQYGVERWRDERMFLASRLPVAPGAFRAYAQALIRSASALFRAPRKLLCTDLDNTLWGGILGEDGPDGIATGHAFPGNCYFAYQTFLRELAARGILLAVSSKNNESDVAEAFRLRAADLALTLDDFVALKIGWGEKAEALRELAQDLSLGLDSFVFVDDNPAECAAIRQLLPEVTVVEVSANEPWRTIDLLAQEWDFDALAVTADDRNRSGEYRAQVQRAALQSKAASRDEFLASLGIVCTFLSAAEAPLERSAQLLAKTNQFNLTTRRYSAAEIMHFVTERDSQALAVRVRDRFGDAGVVGLALTRMHGEECWIDVLLLSCRVIGRGIESAILAYVSERAFQRGAKWMVGEFIETKKNAPCKDFYPDHGFIKDSGGDGAAVYRLGMSQELPQSPWWLTLEGKESYEFDSSAVVVA